MKVLDLQCAHRHAFEGWFASEDDFQGQLARGLVECPMCGDTGIVKMLSAPRLNLGARETTGAAPAAGADAPARAATPSGTGPVTGSGADVMSAPPDLRLQATWMQVMRQVLANTDDVGDRFPEEARRMHYGETDARSIRGRATPEETEALLDEGIQVMPLVVPPALKGPLQ